MAVSPTFPSRDALRRLRFRPLDAVVFRRPLMAYAERFRLEQTEAAQQPRSVVLAALRRGARTAGGAPGSGATGARVNRTRP